MSPTSRAEPVRTFRFKIPRAPVGEIGRSLSR